MSTFSTFQGFEPLFGSRIWIRIRIRISVKSRILICISIKSNPDPHQVDKSNPDPHQGDADLQHMPWYLVELVSEVWGEAAGQSVYPLLQGCELAQPRLQVNVLDPEVPSQRVQELRQLPSSRLTFLEQKTIGLYSHFFHV